MVGRQDVVRALSRRAWSGFGNAARRGSLATDRRRRPGRVVGGSFAGGVGRRKLGDGDHSQMIRKKAWTFGDSVGQFTITQRYLGIIHEAPHVWGKSCHRR